MGTPVATAVQQGAQAFRCVRVTDGTDTAANYAIFYANGSLPGAADGAIQRVPGEPGQPADPERAVRRGRGG